MKSKKIVVWIQKNAFRILCACLLLLCIPMAQQSFRHNELSGGNLQGENYSNPIVKDQEIHILFSPRSAQLSSIQFRLVDVGGGDENADVTVEILDAGGQVVQKNVLEAQQAQSGDWIEIPVEGLQKGTCCEMVLSCDGSQGYRLIFGSVGGAKEITRWVQNGEVQPGVPEIRFYNLNQVRMTNFVFYGALLVLAAAALLVPVRLNGKWTRLAYHIAVIGLTACLAEYVLESCNATGLTALPKVSLLLNVLLIGSAGLLLYVISRRCQIAVLAMDLFFLGLAAVNYYTRMFRGTVLTAQDVFAAGTAMRVMSSYQFTLGWEICILLAAAILTLVLAWREPPAIEKREYRVFRAVIGMLCVVVYGAAMFPPVYTRLGMDDHTFLLERASKTNGYWETILINLNNPLFEKPDGYSDDAVRQLASQYPADPGEQTPNIVVVMVESLADFSRLGDVPAEEDALPFLHSLEGRDDVYKGELVVPVFGGGTVNTEFEALTGCSSASMPGLVNPYSQLIEEKEVAAMPSWLEQCGYSSWALHLEKAANWNRNDAYPFMGLENFTDISQVDTSTLTTVRSDETSEYMRASDASHYAQIEQNFETRSAQPYFSFSVTMQNHGGYLAPGFDSPVKLDEGKNYPLAEQYLGLAWYSDDAFRQFLEYWEQVDEPTMIVMFGDHFPNVEKEFFDEVLGTDRDQLAGQARLLVQTTPVVIWANYDVDYSVLPACFSANYLSAAVLHTAGAPMNSFQQYLFSQMQQMPVYSRYGFVDAQGVYYETLAGTPYESMSRDYELWQYGALERAQELSDVFFLDESAS